jgi:endonuclease/exonuclease/phosphatase family metal-dependent hydrolase
MTGTSFAARAMGDRNIITATLARLPVPSPAFFDEARGAALTAAEHDRLAGALPALSAIEVVRREASGGYAGHGSTVAAWNAERLKYHAPSVELVRRSGADILLLSEADLGMARAGNRHTVADLARDLGMSYVYGVEFVELGLGDSRERAWHANETNAVGFHGNALLTRLPIRDAALIRLDDGGVWWMDAEDGQGRLGSRMAIAAQIETGKGPIVAAVAHLESKSDPEDRGRQTSRLVEALDKLAGDLPVVIGGDFNTNAVPAGSREPEAHEPLFGILARAGYGWNSANDFAVTQRTRPDGTPLPPFTRIDWLFTRGFAASRPSTLPAVDAAGAAISDHELLVATVEPAAK